jgi:hypothetical protein
LAWLAHHQGNNMAAPTKKEKEHWQQVRELGCIIADIHCSQKIDIHHPTGAGMGLKSSHFDVIPLCTNHHSAQTPLPFGHAVHKGTKSFEQNYGTQQSMLEKVRKLLGRDS